MAGRKRKEKGRYKKWIFLCLAIFLLLGAVAFLGVSLSIRQVTFIGNHTYGEDELKSLIFESKKEQSILYAWFQDRFGTHKAIPFIERYEIEFTGIDSVEITVYEKNIVACIEYMDSYMYFDKDGIVVESSSEKQEGVPLISGLSFERIVLHSTLSISDEKVFGDILNLTQLLTKYELSVDKIYFDSQYHVVFYLDGIKVRLGSCEDLDGKITELKQMLPEIQGLTGTLYLDTYSENMPPGSYVFKKEASAPDSEENTPENETEEESGT